MNFTDKIVSFNQIININPNDLSFVYMNIRSLRKHFNTFIVNIRPILYKLSIIILVETNIQNEETQIYQIPNFSNVFLNRDSRGGGIAVYIRENINFTKTEINSKYYETLQIDLSINNNKFTIFPIYRPPKLNVKHFINELDNIINTINNKQNLILIGDINIDTKKSKNKTTNFLL